MICRGRRSTQGFGIIVGFAEVAWPRSSTGFLKNVGLVVMLFSEGDDLDLAV